MKTSALNHDRSVRIVRDVAPSASNTTAGSGVINDRAKIQRVLCDVAERRSGGRFRFAGDELVSLVSRHNHMEMP